MKIYIVTDLEGISGIDSIDLINKDNPNYSFSIGRLMADTNAAIDGAFLGGATEVVVRDGHGNGRNFDLSLLDKRAAMDINESHTYLGMMDESFAGTFQIGCHAMAGTINGFLDHTQSSASWFSYRVNGRPFGEIGQWAMASAHYNVPVLMVSGDEAACAEARTFFNPVECAAVKYGNGRNKANCYDINESLEKIRDAARRSIGLIGKAKPFKPILPIEIVLELYRSDYCDAYANKSGIERINARTVRKVSNSYLDLFI